MTKKEMWQGRLNVWRESGVSGMQFCRQEALSYSNFMRWKKRLTESSASGFIQLGVEQPLSFSVNGISIEVDRGISTKDLGRVIAATKLAGQC